MSWGKAAIADFLAENLPRVGGSYRQFSERRALGEGSSRRFFGGGFAEPAACEGGLAKGSKVWKTTEKPSKKVPKRVQNGTLEAPRSVPESRSRKYPFWEASGQKTQSPKQGPFWSLERSFGAPIFECFLDTLPERLLGDFGA